MFALNNTMRFLFVITLLIVFTNIFAQSGLSENDEKKELKKSLKFDDWAGKNDEMRNGINLSKIKISALSDATEIKPKNTFFISQKDNGESFVMYRSQWHLSKNDFTEITISFLRSGLDAQEYLIDRYMLTPLPFDIRKKSRDEPPVVGDVSFYNGRLFIQNNIIVNIYAEGEMINRIKDIAKAIDAILLTQKAVQSYDDLTPKIKKDSNGSLMIIEP